MSEAEFFDAVYHRADGDESAVPWQSAISRRFIGDWLDGYQPAGSPRALVVAAGLGDDVAALARSGAEVTAFDFSPTAVEWAKARYADLDVDWHVADLFDLPPLWRETFDLVVEVFTIQSIPPARQPAAADAIRALVAPGGTLVAVMLIHHGDGPPGGPPWPVDPATLTRLAAGLDESARRVERVNDQVECVLVELARGR